MKKVSFKIKTTSIDPYSFMSSCCQTPRFCASSRKALLERSGGHEGAYYPVQMRFIAHKHTIQVARALIEDEDDNSSVLEKDSATDVSMDEESPVKVNGTNH